MISVIDIKSFGEYVSAMEIAPLMGNKILFRGQKKYRNLLPSIARKDSHVNTTGNEKRMLEQLLLLGSSKLSENDHNEWNLLIKAQHFELKTRCLDWTSNPLVALWFACDNSIDEDSYVYLFSADFGALPDKSKSPFEQPHVCIYQPSFSNERVTAQHGWFTLHNYDEEQQRFIPLEELEDSNLLEYRIPKEIKNSHNKCINTIYYTRHLRLPSVSHFKTSILSIIAW
ncbi:FRG domain-containing protein [Aliivibrio fischeri]|uniref:FRG domain-containing protein n=1 Tax=Aliivibrio fischeri TaxID=668 RepID=UPI0037356804